MKIKNYTWLLVSLTLLTCKAQQASISTVKAEASSDKKNILFIAVDDLKPLLSNYGHPEMMTPNFDRLSKMGVSFTNAHVQYAVCGPSRASVMTGTNPDKTKVWDLHTDFRESAPDLISMPEYLISQGYETTAVGKIYHKGSSSPGHDGKSWSIPHTQPKNYDSAYGDPAFEYYQNPETKKTMSLLVNEAEAKGITKPGQLRSYVFKRLKPSTESAEVSDEAYQDGIYTQEALKKLNKLIKTGKPWFLGVGYQKPHLPFVAPKKYWDLYDRDKIELAKFQKLSEGTPSFAFHNYGELRAFSDIDDNYDIGDIIDENKQRELIHGYMACISYIDAQLGKLMDALEAKGILDDTIIVLWGDHGWHLGDHAEWCKHSNFEQATRIPFMFSGPGIAKNQNVETPVNLVDLFPTIFELAHVKQSDQTDGKSLVPLLDNDKNTTINMDYAYHQYARGKRMGYSIRTEKYRYTEWHNNDYRSNKPYKDENIVGRELYDYDNDPLETKNWVNDANYKNIATQLKDKLKSHVTNNLK
ncbi:sulfatase [Aestuariibaculum suncheonense]|uniref:Sulfatase n=1 Tax=Aestuariibaculum suncheonense TaxID=1028745 RepID=A0A8J6Q7N6_9FLAO|nr:sulfatase [Aestuariibaculum suncheonense]MBD0835642.1 sulfatase [Aestuariibaculum suncheonense]